jgi:uncharacterized protein (TIGR03435 family)
MTHVALSDGVQWAYGVAFYQISDAHLSGDSYDIRAKTGNPATVPQLRMMLQDLLAKRFKLVLHRESRMLPVYEVTVAKGGAKLPAAAREGDTVALFGLIQEQLGLKLIPAKAPREVVVIDGWEKPSEN